MKPWMTYHQINLIESYLKKDYTFLEYGAGGSTLHFSKFVNKYISIEHDKNWIDKISSANLLSKNTTIYYCPSNNTSLKLPVWSGSYEDFYNYINYVDNIDIKKYDVILIDGRARQYCAKKLLSYIDNNSIVFVHDFFERKRYHSILNYYTLIDKDDKQQPSLAVFHKK